MQGTHASVVAYACFMEVDLFRVFAALFYILGPDELMSSSCYVLVVRVSRRPPRP